jgi:hypothetical protein
MPSSPNQTNAWRPKQSDLATIDSLMRTYREEVRATLMPLVKRYCPSIAKSPGMEIEKMLELSAKMTMVGHACGEVAGAKFDAHRRTMSALFGGCCFLADSFIDDYGDEAARDYVARFERLLTKGWFDIRNDREKLFYIIISRLFSRRNALDPMVRQAIVSLFNAQRTDIFLRLNAPSFRALPRRTQLRMLKQCARDRSGHGILVLAHFVAPGMSLSCHRFIFLSGALIMYIDDHGDYFADKQCNRITYINQVAFPETALRKMYGDTMRRLMSGLPNNNGKRLLCTFLHRYFVTRIEKHKREREKGGLSWSVYE